MSAEKVINWLLSNDPAIKASVGDRIYPGFIPLGKALPAIAYNHVSTVERTTVSMGGETVSATSRIEVTVQAKSYPEQKSLLNAVRAACKNRQGLIAGVQVDSVLRESTGPDFRDDDAGIYMQSLDFRVTYAEPNP